LDIHHPPEDGSGLISVSLSSCMAPLSFSADHRQLYIARKSYHRPSDAF
jgi:hypothetical protein